MKMYCNYCQTSTRFDKRGCCRTCKRCSTCGNLSTGKHFSYCGK